MLLMCGWSLLGIFRNFVMVGGFPTPSREGESGIELSFDLMFTLSNAQDLLHLSNAPILRLVYCAANIILKSMTWHR